MELPQIKLKKVLPFCQIVVLIFFYALVLEFCSGLLCLHQIHCNQNISSVAKHLLNIIPVFGDLMLWSIVVCKGTQKKKNTLVPSQALWSPVAKKTQKSNKTVVNS